MFGHLSNTGNANLTMPMIQDKFQVDNVLICGRSYDGAKKGQTASLSSIWGTSYFLLINVASGDFSNGEQAEPLFGALTALEVCSRPRPIVRNRSAVTWFVFARIGR